MPRKPKPKAARRDVLAPIPCRILDQFVRDGPLTAPRRSRRRPAVQEGADRARAGRRADAPSRLSARRRASPSDTTNHRNGTSGKTVLTDDGPLAIEVPRDREGTFEPQLIGKHERRFTGFDDKILALYARGLTVREIQASSPRCMRSRSRPI